MIEKETPNTKPTETKPKVRRSENFREQPKLYKITRSSHINIKDTQLQHPQTETNAGPSSTKGRPTVLLKDTPETLQNLPQTMFEQSTGSLGIVPQEKKLNTVASVVLEADKKLIATLKKKSGLHQPSTMGFLKGLVSYWRKDMSDISNDDLIEVNSLKKY